MIPKVKPLQAIEKNAIAKAKYTPFFWPVLRGVVLLTALCAFVPMLAGLLDRGSLKISTAVATGVFFLASFTLFAMIAMLPKAGTLRHFRWSDWWFVSYFVFVGLGFNWACAFLLLSRRYGFFSGPVIAAIVLIMAFYAAIALLVGRFAAGNWRAAALVFVFAPYALAGIVLRLGLLR